MRPLRYRRRKQQTGVALIVALLALVLAVLLATALIDSGESTAARWRNSWRAEQSWQLLRGMEAWAVEGLLADQRSSGYVDSLDELWARPITPIEIPGAVLRGQLRDLGGCFNINSLLNGGEIDALALRRFERLLAALKLPPELAAQTADWLDRDATPRANGAEDAFYSSRRPSHRAANNSIVTTSELLDLPAMTAELWPRLEPLICALPSDQRINLNTAPLELWLTLDDRLTVDIARRLHRAQARAYPDMAAIQEALQREGLAGIDLAAYSVQSQYFLALSDIRADAIQFYYSSIFQRSTGRVTVIARARGGLVRPALVESTP